MTTKTTKAVWAGRVLTALPMAFFLWDAALKLVQSHWVVEAMTRLGYPDIAVGLGVLEVALVALHLVPRTRVLGAVLFTGYLGGAVASHVRIGDPFIFPIVFGAMIWAGLYLRDEQVRGLVGTSRAIEAAPRAPLSPAGHGAS